MFWIMSTDMPSNLCGWFLSHPVCATCIARGTSWQESLLSNKCNILPLVTKLSPQFPPFLSAVAQSAHLSRGEVNLSFQQERAHKCCATSVIQFGHSTGLYSQHLFACGSVLCQWIKHLRISHTRHIKKLDFAI